MAYTIDAVFEHGVFRPLEPVALEEGKRVRISLDSPDSKPSPDLVLKLATRVYEGLSQNEINEIEAIALDRSRFFSETREK